MSNETKPLTAAEFYQECAFLVPYPKGRNIAVVTVDDAYEKMQERTAALREKLTAYESGGHTLIPTPELDALRAELAAASMALEQEKNFRSVDKKDFNKKNFEIDHLRGQLEAVKKENADWKARNLEYSYQVAVKSCVMFQGQLNEAAKLLEKAKQVIRSLKLSMLAHPDHKEGSEFDDLTTTAENTEREISGALARLSYGETKPPDSLTAASSQMAELKHQKAQLLDKEAELEAVKKERDEQKNRVVDLVLFINTLAPNMAEQFARHDYRSMWEIWEMLRGHISSGETKPSEPTNTKPE